MKKLILLVLAVVPMLGIAQPICQFSVSLEDQNCSSDTWGCPPNKYGACSSTSFTPTCTSTYYLDAVTQCNGGSACYHCAVCAVVIPDGQTMPILYCGTESTCGWPQYGCNCVNNATLTADTKYTLYVCLMSCPGESCQGCLSDCQAKACVRWNTLPSCF